MMDAKRIEEMKRLSAEATEGPWEIERNTDDDVFVTDIWIDGEDGGHIEIHGDTVASSINHAQFIAESRQFVPDIIEAYEDQAEEIAKLRKALEFYADDMTHTYNSVLRDVPIGIDDGHIAREALSWRNTTRK